MWRFTAFIDRAPLPGFFIPLYHLALIFSLSCPPAKVRKYIPLAVLLALSWKLTSYTAGAALTNYSIGTAVGQIIVRWVDFGVLSHPETDFRRQDGEPKSQTGQSLNSESWLKKLKWSSRLMTTARGIGWSWQVKNVPPHIPAAKSTSYVILHRVPFRKQLLIFFTTLGILFVYISSEAYISISSRTSASTYCPHLHLLSKSLLWPR
jgi:hypothetical protein